jgi:hypothetical protein
MVESVEIITDKLIIRGEGLCGINSAERAHKRELARGRTNIWESMFGKFLASWLIQYFLQIWPGCGPIIRHGRPQIGAWPNEVVRFVKNDP